MKLSRLLRLKKQIRVAGFDDACFDRERETEASLCGIVCSNTRFEGMLWGSITLDGTDATERIADLLLGSKFGPQVHVVLLDGLTFGGMNLVDLQELHDRTGMPCVAVMRKAPDLKAFSKVLDIIEGTDGERRRRLQAAGPVHQIGGFVFQTVGASPSDVAAVLEILTDQGNVPEALRLAHLIGTAVKTGQSGKRA